MSREPTLAREGWLDHPQNPTAYGDTCVVTLLVLFPEIGSFGDVAVTTAVSVKSPFFVGLTTIVTVTVAPLCILPMLHTTTCLCGFGAQLPCVDVTEPNPVFFGMLSVIFTPLAVEGPLFVTVIV